MRAQGAERLLAALMIIQSALGLAFHEQYRDVEWIRLTWYGNDWVTLVVAAPLLLFGGIQAHRGKTRGAVLQLGVTGYAAYNYAFYLFGSALNVFFPLYVALVLLPVAILIVALPGVDVVAIATGFRPVISTIAVATCFVLLAIGLAAVWVGTWAAYVFFGRPTPVEPDAFRLVAALDLSVMVPLLVLGALLLRRNSAWGILVSAIAGVQASIYLLVLSVNAIVAVRSGIAAWPSEIPLWIALLLGATAATLALFVSIRDEPRPFGVRA